MKVIGIDIGTTSISSVVMDTETGAQLDSMTLPNDTAVAGPGWARQQDPEKILQKCFDLLSKNKKNWPDIPAIGLTGQMHGILYVDKDGNAISPLVTWEDERGNLEFRNNKTYVQVLQELTGYPMATGYGLSTHFYNLQNGLVPEGCAAVTTIMDFVAMKLAGSRRPVIHASNAASLGLFRLKERRFDQEACLAAGIDPDVLPRVLSSEEIMGETPDGMSVILPIGDNQAGILGLVQEPGDVVVNIGTSSQISMVSRDPGCAPGLESRPYIDGQFLHIGAGLCGGTSFSLLNDFFCDVCRLFSAGADRDRMFDLMMEAAEEAYGRERKLLVRTQFRGRRSDPSVRGSIEDIDMTNFTPGSLVLGFYRGVCMELYEAYQQMKANPLRGRLLLCGNALRNNPVLRRICAEVFQREITMIDRKEETAAGAAILAFRAVKRQEFSETALKEKGQTA